MALLPSPCRCRFLCPDTLSKLLLHRLQSPALPRLPLLASLFVALQPILRTRLDFHSQLTGMRPPCQPLVRMKAALALFSFPTKTVLRLRRDYLPDALEATHLLRHEIDVLPKLPPTQWRFDAPRAECHSLQ
eukprot:Lithocolla_globosa_v1_NODE_3004_length_1798_cov_4.131956.p2 type:complete len:132 gc:universal NODE_3004_length_1798_cov_4.131956:541-936(+)